MGGKPTKQMGTPRGTHLHHHHQRNHQSQHRGCSTTLGKETLVERSGGDSTNGPNGGQASPTDMGGRATDSSSAQASSHQGNMDQEQESGPRRTSSRAPLAAMPQMWKAGRDTLAQDVDMQRKRTDPRNSGPRLSQPSGQEPRTRESLVRASPGRRSKLARATATMGTTTHLDIRCATRPSSTRTRGYHLGERWFRRQ